MAPTPVTATIFAYQVGFGDCFLLRFDYDDLSARHILIDFGTMGMPKDDPSVTMKGVADDIAERCNHKLDIVVATHRHADHISGFETKHGTGSGDVIRKLKPKRVIQPWTEAPDAPEKWEGPEGTDPATAFAARVLSLEAMHAVAEAVVARLDRDGGFDPKWPLAPRLRFIGEDNIKNVSAVKNLMTMAGEDPEDKAKYLYVFHGCDLDLDEILPGVKIHVLGPPTLRQTQRSRGRRRKALRSSGCGRRRCSRSTPRAVPPRPGTACCSRILDARTAFASRSCPPKCAGSPSASTTPRPSRCSVS